MDVTIYTHSQALAAFKIFFMNCGIEIDNEIVYDYTLALNTNFNQVQQMFIEWLQPLIKCELVKNQETSSWLVL